MVIYSNIYIYAYRLSIGGTEDILVPKRIISLGTVLDASCGWLHTALIVKGN